MLSQHSLVPSILFCFICWVMIICPSPKRFFKATKNFFNHEIPPKIILKYYVQAFLDCISHVYFNPAWSLSAIINTIHIKTLN